MKNTTNQHHKGKKAALLALAFPLVLAGAPVQAAQRTYVASETALPSPQIVGIKRLNPTAVEVLFANNQRNHPKSGSQTRSTDIGRQSQNVIVKVGH